MIKVRKLASAFLALVMTASLLTACGDGKKNDSKVDLSSNASDNSKVSQAATGENVSLRFAWWGSDARHEATLNAIELYESKYPNVKIEGEYQGYDGYQQKLMTQMAGGTEPDLITLDYVWYPDLSAQSSAFLDLSSAQNVDLTTYNQATLDDFCTMDDKIIALPMGLNGFGIMINKAFYEKHNIPEDTQWTWESMIEKGREINSSNSAEHLFAIESGTSTGGLGPFVLNSYLYSKTGKYWTSDETKTIDVTKEELAEAFKIIKDLYESGTAQPIGEASLFTGQMEQNPKWLNNEMGFTVDWSGTIGKYQEAIGAENFTVGTPPSAKDGKNTEIANKPSMVLAVSNNSANAETAAHFANWLLNDPEAAVILGTQRSIPANSNSLQALKDADAIDPAVSQMVEAASENPAPPAPFIQGNSEVADIVKNICEEVAFGTIEPDAAADKFITEVGAKLTAVS